MTKVAFSVPQWARSVEQPVGQRDDETLKFGERERGSGSRQVTEVANLQQCPSHKKGLQAKVLFLSLRQQVVEIVPGM